MALKDKLVFKVKTSKSNSHWVVTCKTKQVEFLRTFLDANIGTYTGLGKYILLLAATAKIAENEGINLDTQQGKAIKLLTEKYYTL